MTTQDDRCTKQIWDGTIRGHRCNRRVKADGLCAQHLAGQKAGETRRQARIDEDARRAQAQLRKQHEVTAKVTALRELGVDSTAHVSRLGNVSGKVLVDPDDLLAVLKGENR